VRIAVNRCGRAEDQPFDAAGCHDKAEGNGAFDVVFVIAQGLGDGFPNGFEPGKVDGGGDGMLLKDVI